MRHVPLLRVYITGVPATGKSSVAIKISQQLALSYFEINDIVLNNGFYLGYDINRDTFIIDDDLLVPHLESLIINNKHLCLVGSLFPLGEAIDIIIVLRCPIPVLRQRLKERGYNEEKIESNIEAEIMNIIYYDALEFYSEKLVYEVINHPNTIDNTCKQIISIIEQHFSRNLV